MGDQGREGVIGRGEVRGDADGGAIVAAAGRPTRRGELDALRALVVVGLVLFHTAVIFGAGEFPVKAAAENRVVTVLIAFGAIWGMPLLFLISGIGVRSSLRSRDAGAFARERLRRLGGLLARPGGILLPAVAIAAVELALGSGVGHGGWGLGGYALFLLCGYLTAADPRVGQAFQRYWRPAAVLGLLLFVATAVAAFAALDARVDPFTGMDPLSLAFRLLKGVDGWLWVVAILGFARARIGRPRSAPTATSGRARRLAAYANDAVLPFYVLHETVIVVVAYAVLSWPIGGGLQYCLIASVSLAATLVLYDLGVRRHPVTRFLFGLKPQPRAMV